MNKLGAIIQFFRRFKYRLLSTNKRVGGQVKRHQPVQVNGRGVVYFRENVQIGVYNSAMFYNTYAYIEARTPEAIITLEKDVAINNNFCAVANESSITIGEGTTIGVNCQIYNCNFHSLDPEKRRTSTGESKAVLVGKNVFIGNNVTILKGVTIGDNAVIAAGSVVTKNVEINSTYRNIG